MRSTVPFFSLTLIFVLSFCLISHSKFQVNAYKHFHQHGRFAGRDGRFAISSVPSPSGITKTPQSTGQNFLDLNTALPRALPQATGISCEEANETLLTATQETDSFVSICDIDFMGQDIYPFILAGSFEQCLISCVDYNKRSGTNNCAGFLFAPERVEDVDDCYLKSSLNNPMSATIHLVGATLVSQPVSSSLPSHSQHSVLTRSSTHYASATGVTLRTPSVQDVKLLGSSTNNPTKQYVSHLPALPQKLATSMLVPGINMDLITEYPIASDTGSWTNKTSPLKIELSDMTVIPHVSRDGGKGGTINGTHLFIFCDTANFKTCTSTIAGDMVGFVSSSVATDDGMHGLDGQPLTLVDQIGEWQDDVGRMRSFAPLTTGEEIFNIALSGDGHRYAVWPESSLITLNQTHALLYAVLVYDEVNMKTQEANFTTLGNTLLLVSVDSQYGPNAQRIVNLMFQQQEVTFGTLGGIRAWGSSGIGGMDGSIYLFGQANNGVLVAKTSPTGFANISSYTYFNGSLWITDMPSQDSSATIFDQDYMDLDVIYSPHHRNFIMIYLNCYADNTFYYRFLNVDHAIVPPYEDDGDPNYVEQILSNGWSNEQVLYTASTPAMGYIYAGGLHAGYFGDDDITNGGQKALLSWTEHTGKDAATPESGYAHKTIVVTFE